MKVYIVLKYIGVESEVVDVFPNKEAAITKVVRTKNNLSVKNQSTFHIIQKSVKGLAGINIKVDGKKRYILGKIKENG